jgi:hypothetical protein
MGKQYNKVEKRNRRKRYLDRKKAKFPQKNRLLKQTRGRKHIPVVEQTPVETVVKEPQPPVKKQKPEIYIEQYFGGITYDVLRIKYFCGAESNEGSLCFRNHHHGLKHLDLQIGLINQIAAQGGDFLALPTLPPDNAIEVGSGLHSYGNPPNIMNRGKSACWGGAPYVSWRAYRDVGHAISYLKRYFRVIACPTNVQYTQADIDACP